MVSQTDESVIICIKVPHVRVGSAETHIDGREFSFYCKPYLLRYWLFDGMTGLFNCACVSYLLVMKEVLIT